MEVNKTDLLALYKAFGVLKPYLGQIVLVGGWVPVIYRFDLIDSTPKMMGAVIEEMKSIQTKYARSWARRATSNLERYFPESGGQGPALVGSQYTGAMPIATFRNYVQRVFRDLIAGLKRE